jgi:hypothetical protein
MKLVNATNGAMSTEIARSSAMDPIEKRITKE